MTPNRQAQLESTLLSVIAQAHARGAKFEDVKQYVDRLQNPSSRTLVDNLFGRSGASEGPSPLRRWAETLAY